MRTLRGVTRVGDTRGGNWRCHPYFFLKKTNDPFLLITVCQFCGVAPIYFLQKNDGLFCSSLSLLFISLGCHPLEGVTLQLFHLSDLVCPLFFVNLPTKNFSRVSPPGWCHPERMGPPPVPPSDATVYTYRNYREKNKACSLVHCRIGRRQRTSVSSSIVLLSAKQTTTRLTLTTCSTTGQRIVLVFFIKEISFITFTLLYIADIEVTIDKNVRILLSPSTIYLFI